jgi:hypothetical protein
VKSEITMHLQSVPPKTSPLSLTFRILAGISG